MKINYTCLIILLLIIGCSTTNNSKKPQNDRFGIVYGDNYGFVYSVQAPDGWILDNKAGIKQGLNAVFYPRGSSWDTSAVVMYTNFFKANNQSTKSAIDNELKIFKNNSPNLLVEELGDLELDSINTKASIYKLTKDQYNNYEAIGYLRDKDYIAFFVLNSRQPELFDKYLSSFFSLIRSYKRIQITIQIK